MNADLSDLRDRLQSLADADATATVHIAGGVRFTGKVSLVLDSFVVLEDGSMHHDVMLAAIAAVSSSTVAL